VGSYSNPESCGGIADVSRDGVRDLAGSMKELVADVFARYDAPCWGPIGIVRDPLCTGDEDDKHAIRGSSWTQPGTVAVTMLRGSTIGGDSTDDDEGFRCVYPGFVE
jgi:hypothetical protein